MSKNVFIVLGVFWTLAISDKLAHDLSNVNVNYYGVFFGILISAGVISIG